MSHQQRHHAGNGPGVLVPCDDGDWRESHVFVGRQVARAYALAQKHSHEWAWSWYEAARAAYVQDYREDPAPGWEPEPPCTMQEARATHEAWGSKEWPGLAPATEHTTGSGRVWWKVDADGSVRVEIRRPAGVVMTLSFHDSVGAGFVVHATTGRAAEHGARALRARHWWAARDCAFALLGRSEEYTRLCRRALESCPWIAVEESAILREAEAAKGA